MDPFGGQPTPPRRGRRDNGLDADRYVPLLDVDPRVGEHLLDVLRLAGVPAYLEPSMDVEPYTRSASVPSPPTDRLWVDRERRDTARDIITAETSTGGTPDPDAIDDLPSRGLTDPDEELAWRDIVARYDRDDSARGGVPPWPVAEDLDRPRPPGPEAGRAAPPGAGDRPEPPAAGGPARGRASRAAHPGRPPGHPGADGGADPEEHYIPPAPPPIPRLSKQAVVALILIAVGTVLLLSPQAVGFSAQSGLALGVVSLVSAGGLLVLRLREDRHDDPDDGAVL
jgi:hypothetical protein